jgi:hypothetical protein
MRPFLLVLVGLLLSMGVGCSSSTVVQPPGAGGSSGSAGTGGSGTGGSGTGGSAGGGNYKCVADAGCSGSGCVQTLYSGEAKPGPLSVDSSLAYWVARGTKTALRAGPKKGGCVAKTLIPDLQISGQVKQMVGDADAIYLGTTDPAKPVLRFDKTTQKLSVMVDNTACSTGGYGFLAQNSTLVAYACKDSSGEVDGVTKLAPNKRSVLAPGPLPQLEGIALDEGGVYVANGTNLGTYTFSGGGTSLYVDANATQLALGDMLYWLKGTELWDGKVAGNGEHSRYAGLVDPQVLAADKMGAYVGDLGTGDGDGRIAAALTGQPGATLLANSENHPTAIATDAVYVYWTNLNGTVRRAKRP